VTATGAPLHSLKRPESEDVGHASLSVTYTYVAKGT
jgi:hypothetical protein